MTSIMNKNQKDRQALALCFQSVKLSKKRWNVDNEPGPNQASTMRVHKPYQGDKEYIHKISFTERGTYHWVINGKQRFSECHQ